MARLNVQGLSRKSESLMKCIISRPGYTLIGSDGVSFEPTVSAHYSRDINYRLATVDMVGKSPYYQKDMLVIDDIYLMVASVFPKFAKQVRDCFNSDFNGHSFSEQWLLDKEVITKGALKNIRNMSKVCCLGISYSMGAKKLVLTGQQNGFDISEKDAKQFIKLYWETFPRLKLLGEKLAEQYALRGYLQNEFGYVLYPSAPYKCLNSIIQSTVSGLISALCQVFFSSCSDAIFMFVWHDEIIFEVPDDKLTEVKARYFECIDHINRQLGWSVPIRFNWTEGKTLYECK